MRPPGYRASAAAFDDARFRHLTFARYDARDNSTANCHDADRAWRLSIADQASTMPPATRWEVKPINWSWMSRQVRAAYPAVSLPADLKPAPRLNLSSLARSIPAAAAAPCCPAAQSVQYCTRSRSGFCRAGKRRCGKIDEAQERLHNRNRGTRALLL
jgi:hypothetical protein